MIADGSGCTHHLLVVAREALVRVDEHLVVPAPQRRRNLGALGVVPLVAHLHNVPPHLDVHADAAVGEHKLGAHHAPVMLPDLPARPLDHRVHDARHRLRLLHAHAAQDLQLPLLAPQDVHEHVRLQVVLQADEDVVVGRLGHLVHRLVHVPEREGRVRGAGERSERG